MRPHLLSIMDRQFLLSVVLLRRDPSSHVSSLAGQWVSLTLTPHPVTAIGLGAFAVTAECLSYSHIYTGCIGYLATSTGLFT